MIRSILTGMALTAGVACLPGSASAQNFNGTCPRVWQTGPILNATCLNAFGGLVNSSIDLRSCPRYAIGNGNGRLVCTVSRGGPGWGGPPPRGPGWGGGPPPPGWGGPPPGRW